MYTRKQILKITKTSPNLWAWCKQNRLIPGLSKFVELRGSEEGAGYPMYVLHDLWHISMLCRLCKELKEIKKLTLGGTGLIKYEIDIRREIGKVLIVREEPDLRGAIRKMASLVEKMVENRYPSYKVIHKTLRCTNIKGEKYVILSRLILAPRPNFVISDNLDLGDIVFRNEIELLLPYSQELLSALSSDYYESQKGGK